MTLLRFTPGPAGPVTTTVPPTTVPPTTIAPTTLPPTTVPPTTVPASVVCQVRYSRTWDNGDAFGAQITLTNLGPTVTNWTVTWQVPATQSLMGSWGVVVTQGGTTMTGKPEPWYATLATGASATFGYGVADPSGRVTPTFRLNGAACTLVA